MAFVINYCEECGARIDEPGQTLCKKHRPAGAPAQPMSPRPTRATVSASSARIRRTSARVAGGTTRIDRSDTQHVVPTQRAGGRERRAALTVAGVLVLALAGGGALIAIGSATQTGGPRPRPPQQQVNPGLAANPGDRNGATAGTNKGSGPDPSPPAPPSNQPGPLAARAVDLTAVFRDGSTLTGAVRPGVMQLIDGTGKTHHVNLADISRVHASVDTNDRAWVAERRTGDPIEGRPGSGELRMSAGDADFVLDPATLRELRQPGPALVDEAGSRTIDGLGQARRLADPNEIDLVIKPTRRIGFDQSPTGEMLQPGQDISRAFVAWGCLLETSLDTRVSPNAYVVPGGGGGLSCASLEPPWQGILTIRFCVPGDASRPATVTCAGLWIAQVRPNGTSLEAWDAKDRLITAVTVTSQPADYLSVASPVPIAKLRVVPNVEVDPDYAIDDLAFDVPRERVAPDVATVELTNGDRVTGRRLTMQETRVTLYDTAISAVLAWPRTRVKCISMPAASAASAASAAECFVRLADGSTVRAIFSERAFHLGSASAPLPPGQVLGVWGQHTVYAEPPPMRLPAAGEAMAMDGRQMQKHAPNGWTIADGRFQLSDGRGVDLNRTPMLWFAAPPTVAPAVGRLWLNNGECYVLQPAGSDGFHLGEWGPDKLTLTHDRLPAVKITPSMVRRCEFPR